MCAACGLAREGKTASDETIEKHCDGVKKSVAAIAFIEAVMPPKLGLPDENAIEAGV